MNLMDRDEFARAFAELDVTDDEKPRPTYQITDDGELKQERDDAKE